MLWESFSGSVPAPSVEVGIVDPNVSDLRICQPTNQNTQPTRQDETMAAKTITTKANNNVNREMQAPLYKKWGSKIERPSSITYTEIGRASCRERV